MNSMRILRLLALALVLPLATRIGRAQGGPEKKMEFTLGSLRSELQVKIEYEDPSTVDPRLNGSRVVPMRVDVRNISSNAVRLDYDDIKLSFSGGEPLSPVAIESAVDEVRKLKRIPGFLSFIGNQSSAFQPKALESLLNRQRLRDGEIRPGESKTGVVFFMRPEEPFNGVIWLEPRGMPPQILQTKGVDVYTKPGPPSLAARLQKTLSRLTDTIRGAPPAFNRSYALLVGIQKYRFFGNLEWSAKDTEKMRQFLIGQGFDEIVTVSEETVTAEGLKNPQKYFSAKIQEDDRFLFYFSGHGQSIKLDGAWRGFIPLRDEVPGETSRSIPMESMVSWMRNLKTGHLLVILDSCFSGLASGGIQTKSATRPPNPGVDMEEFNRLSRGPARYLLMAGTGRQESLASDKWQGSLFTEMVVRGLRKEADLYSNKLVTARELFVWLQAKVSSEALNVSRELTPLLMDLGPNGVSPGEFVFVQ